jgi:hypothetical protein
VSPYPILLPWPLSLCCCDEMTSSDFQNKQELEELVSVY